MHARALDRNESLLRVERQSEDDQGSKNESHTVSKHVTIMTMSQESLGLFRGGTLADHSSELFCV